MYPRWWRDRYEDEVAALLEARPEPACADRPGPRCVRRASSRPRAWEGATGRDRGGPDRGRRLDGRRGRVGRSADARRTGRATSLDHAGRPRRRPRDPRRRIGRRPARVVLERTDRRAGRPGDRRRPPGLGIRAGRGDPGRAVRRGDGDHAVDGGHRDRRAGSRAAAGRRPSDRGGRGCRGRSAAPTDAGRVARGRGAVDGDRPVAVRRGAIRDWPRAVPG